MFWNMFIVCIELIVVVIVQCYGVSVWYVCILLYKICIMYIIQ